MNNVSIIGRLTKDNEVRYSQTATPVATLKNSIAVNRVFKKEGEPTADFINISAFGKTAELMEKYSKKGEQIGVRGRIQTGSYEKDGVKRYTTEVVVEQVTFIGGKAQGGDAGTPSTEADDDLPF